MENLSPADAQVEDLITCTSCLTVNEESRAYCQKCGAPFTRYGSLDPMQHIKAEAHVLRRATEGRPNLIIVLGVWLLFFPVLVLSGSGAITLLLYQRDRSALFPFWLSFGVACLSLYALYRVTKNYLTIPALDEDFDDEHEEDE